jgi:ADP-ribosylglycohydrolase
MPKLQQMFIIKNQINSEGRNSTKMPLVIDRFRGCLLGLAAGDALGTTLEFKAPGRFIPLEDMAGGGPFGLQPGQWTDDTSMALCLADSLIERQAFDPIDQLERYWRWYREGYLSSTGKCFDIGNTTREGLESFHATHHPYAASVDSSIAGNGSLMRLAPLPMFFAADPVSAVEKSGESSRTTHADARAVDACRFYAGLLVGALYGVSKEELLSAYYCPLPGYWESHLLNQAIGGIAGGSYKHKQPPQIKGTGYVVDCLEAALWAFYTTTSFQEGCLKAVNLGDDADTTGAVYGQIAGAFYGDQGIPEGWRSKLYAREQIIGFADKLFKHSNS